MVLITPGDILVQGAYGFSTRGQALMVLAPRDILA